MARRSRFVRPAPRTKMWIGAGVGNTTVTGATDNLVSTLSAGALLLRPFTILRTRMDLQVRSDQQVASEIPFGFYGKLVVTDTAAVLGITALPGPSGISGSPEAAWFVWQAVSLAFFVDINGTDGIGLDANGSMHYVIDSKSMRKVGPDDDVVTVFANEVAAGMSLTTNGRMLI